MNHLCEGVVRSGNTAGEWRVGHVVPDWVLWSVIIAVGLYGPEAGFSLLNSERELPKQIAYSQKHRNVREAVRPLLRGFTLLGEFLG